jgi:DNA-binding NarL/FixJ family response regulator
VNSYSVYACETQPIVLEGLRSVLASTEDFRLVGSSPRVAGAIDETGELKPDIAILDHSGGWREVYAFVSELQAQSLPTGVVVWGVDLSPTDCYRAIQMGVRGVFRRDLPIVSFLECLRDVVAGRVWYESGGEPVFADPRRVQSNMRLTPRERDIVELVAQGLKNREIAGQLSITTGTVKVHLMHVFEKTGVNDRYELAVQARGLLERPAQG